MRRRQRVQEMEIAVVPNLVTNVRRFLKNRVSSSGDVDKHIIDLHLKLDQIEKLVGNRRVVQYYDNTLYDETCLEDELMKVAHEVEDIIDDHAVKTDDEKYNKGPMLEKLLNCIVNFKNLIDRACMHDKKRDDDKYRVSGKEAEEEEEEEDVDHEVGLEDVTEELVNELVREEGRKELEVMSITGMGGLGKTTCARKVYKDPLVEGHFSCRAWVTLPQTKMDLKELLLEIHNQVTQPMNKAEAMDEEDEEQLKQEIKKQLSGPDHGRYLLVLDGLWTSDEDWDELRSAFPNEGNGSRVLITTRFRGVALALSTKPPFNLRSLNEQESFQLFERKVRAHNSDLEEKVVERVFDRLVVEKCDGLPQAILACAAYVAGQITKESLQPQDGRQIYEDFQAPWRRIYEDFHASMIREPKYLDILGFSYVYLPPTLKPCFLYLGIFPPFYKISAKQLIRMWIAEGFIQQQHHDHHQDEDDDDDDDDDSNNDKKKKKLMSEEEVGMNYLRQLVDWNLIQAEETSTLDGSSIKTCGVHPVTKFLCVELSRGEIVHRLLNIEPQQRRRQTRRLSLSLSDQTEFPFDFDHVRTVFICFRYSYGIGFNVRPLLEDCRMLRVLDLEVEKTSTSLPTDIDKHLIFLKYLKVKTTHLDHGVPSSVFNLPLLQVLDVRGYRIDELPEGIWGMQNLRHLYLDGPGRLPPNPSKKRLHNLQTLCYVSNVQVDHHPAQPAAHGQQVPHLADKTPISRKLKLAGLCGFFCCKSSDVLGTGTGTAQTPQQHEQQVHIPEIAPNLRKLGLYGYHYCDSSSDEEISTFNLKFLQSLKIIKPFNFGKPIKLPHTLTSVSLEGAVFEPETMEMFHKQLPRLRRLKLDRAVFIKDELVLHEGWFPKLRFLKIQNSKIPRLESKEGTMPKLEELFLIKCPGLNNIPKEHREAIAARGIELSWLPENFNKAISEFKNSDL